MCGVRNRSLSSALSGRVFKFGSGFCHADADAPYILVALPLADYVFQADGPWVNSIRSPHFFFGLGPWLQDSRRKTED